MQTERWKYPARTLRALYPHEKPYDDRDVCVWNMTHFVWSQLYENMSWIKNITSNTLFCSVVYIVLLFPIQFCFSLFGHVKWSYSILFYSSTISCSLVAFYCIFYWSYSILFYSYSLACSDILFSFCLLFHVCLCCSSSFSSILFLLMHFFSFLFYLFSSDFGL